MSMSSEEFAEKTAIQESVRGVGQIVETPQDRVLREAMLIDPLITDLLTGDLFKVLDGLHVWVVAAQKTISDKKTYNRLLYLLDRFYEEWERTKRFRPYLILLSHLTSLTNISPQEGIRYRRKIDLLIGRDLIDMVEDEIEITDINFFAALKMACHFRTHDAEKGWKARIITEQRKRILAEVKTSPKKKGGLFGRGGRFL